MYKKIISASILLLLSTFLLIGCSEKNVKLDDIKTITLNFEGNPVNSYSCVLNDKQNIEESIRIYNELLSYKSPDIETWKEDITYTIECNDGKVKTKVFKNIRPVDDIFEKVFTSMEVRRQWESIFRVNEDSIENIKLISRQKKKEITLSDSNDIKKIIDSIRNFEETVDNDKDYLVIGDIEFYNKDEENIGEVVIVREDKDTVNILDELGILSDIAIQPTDIENIVLENEDDIEADITNEDIIQIVLDNYYDNTTSDSVISVQINLKNDETKMHGSFYKDNVPEIIENLFDLK